MSYQVIIPKSVQKELDRLPKKVIDDILEKLLELTKNPRPQGCKKLAGREAWRIRSGSYRVIYKIHDQKKEVILFGIRHRRDVYR